MTLKLPYLPEQNGYSVRHANEAIRTQLGGGESRVRSDVIGAPHEVGASWLLNREQYQEFMNFLNVAAGRCTLPFLADLIVDFWAPTQYMVKAIPGSVRTTRVEGHSYRVSMDLEVSQVEFLVAEIEFAGPDQILIVDALPGADDVQVIFAPGDALQIVGGSVNNGVQPVIELDGIYTVDSIPTPAILFLDSPTTQNADWTVLDSVYPGGLSGAILNVAIIKVPT